MRSPFDEAVMGKRFQNRPLFSLYLPKQPARNFQDASAIDLILALDHSLGLKVIAEGVETAGQHDFLSSVGCDAFQGYYFGHPGEASALANYISKSPVWPRKTHYMKKVFSCNE